MIDIPLMKHQSEFCADVETPFLALIGGFGCGKTFSFCVKTIILAALNAGYEGAIAEPTNYLTRTHLIPNMEQALATFKIPYDFSKSDGIFYLHFREGTTKIYCLSGENYMRLVGYNLAFFGSDETDTTGHEIAQEMWNKAISRVRRGPVRQIYSTSTPEGYRFLHDFFVTKAAPDRRTIHASSYDNPLLPKDFLERMKSNYTEAQWQVWAMGKFGNLNTLRVYDSFDRHLNHTDLTYETAPKHSPIHVGMDFNIGYCAAIAHVILDNRPRAIEEFVNVRDVPTMCGLLSRRFAGRRVIVYPDASGKNGNATGLSTAHAQLKQAGFELKVNPANPPVGDRVNSMNAMLLNASGERRYLINTRMCPTYTNSLEQQGWVKSGSTKEPDKSNNVDHPLDAGGYFIHFTYPLQGKPTLRQYG